MRNQFTLIFNEQANYQLPYKLRLNNQIISHKINKIIIKIKRMRLRILTLFRKSLFRAKMIDQVKAKYKEYSKINSFFSLMMKIRILS